MTDQRFNELFTRHKANPIIQAGSIPYQVNSVFNAVVTCVGNDTLLLMRVEDRRGISHLTAARSRDGVTEGDDVRLYYGGADKCIALATTRVSQMLDWLEKHKQKGTEPES
jgi:predicted GH43/DUF377 family glycosyl hydrolase